MAILAECPDCHRKQSTKNKKCKCGLEFDKAKKSNRVRYWISYYYIDPQTNKRQQKRESVGAFEGLDPYSISDARKAESKRTVQKKEKRLFDIVGDSKITFNQMAEWYKGLNQIKKLSSYRRITAILANFNKVYGQYLVINLKYTDLTTYQDLRLEQKASPRTVDYEISVIKTMLRRAKYDKKVDYSVLEIFEPLERKLKPGSNARRRTLSFQEYLDLKANAPQHLRVILVTAYYTGMRAGELLNLRWSFIDKGNKGFIRLPAKATKEKRDKKIPICNHVKSVLNSVPKAVHHDYVFTYRGNYINEGGIKKSFKTACKNAEIPHGRKVEAGVTFHDLRRTFKTNMVNAGVDKAYRDIILGHSLKGMDQYYITPSEDNLTEAMAKYMRFIDQNLEVKLESSDHPSDQAKV